MAFSVVALMLYVAGFPIFLLFFVGVLTFFIWKVFSSDGRHETRRIFEFYLAANEILREDERRWFGFEIQETIMRGESIARSMSAAPPLVYFGLGALYQKLNDHAAAVKNFSRGVDDASADESAIVYPTKELREYVRMLRKIERAPAEAPQTSKAIRSLERLRKNRAKTLLEHSRTEMAKTAMTLPPAEPNLESVVDIARFRNPDAEPSPDIAEFAVPLNGPQPDRSVKRKKSNIDDRETSSAERQTISEVLHDIYDKNV